MNIPTLMSKKILASGGSLEIDGNVNIVGRLNVGTRNLEDYLSDAVDKIIPPVLYTWIKYSANENGLNLTDDVREDTRYIGMAYNKTSPIESLRPSDYKWSLFKAEDGIDGQSGRDSINMLMSNENITLTADFDGSATSSDYDNARTSISLIQGVNLLKYKITGVGYVPTVTRNSIEYNINIPEESINNKLEKGEWLINKIVFDNISPSSDDLLLVNESLEYITSISPMNMIDDSAKITYYVKLKDIIGEIVELNKSQTLSKSKVGPGVLFRGDYDPFKEYYHSAKRRDAVFYNPTGAWENSYWLTANTTLNGQVWPRPQLKEDDPGNPWTPFGAQFSSIATGVIISEESYVKNTLNVGTNNAENAGNITLWGGSDKPWMSIGQGGTAMQYGATGIWMGIDTDNKAKLSMGNLSNYLKWTGNELDIKGKITITGGNAASKDYVDDNINSLDIVGKNLILDSKIEEDFNAYGFATREVNLVAGESYVLSANGNIANAQNNKYLKVFIYNLDWSFGKGFGITSVQDETSFIAFNDHPTTGTYYISAYYYDGTEPRTGSVKLNWYKLEKGNIATDWTPAPEDVEAAINAIKSTLSDISNDNKLTADEKQTVKKEWDAIAGEYSKLIAQADNLSVSRTVYAGVYSVLNSYLNVTIISPNTQPLLANLNTTSDIVGSTFRDNFTNYYNARTDLQNALTAKVQTNLSNTNPAGKNYLINSRTDNLTGWFLDGGTATVRNDAKYKNVVEYSRPGGGGNYMKTFQIDRSELKNTELVYYCIAKPISTNPVFNFGGWSETVGHLNQNSSFRNLGDGWRLYFRVFNAGGEIASSGTLGLNSVGGTWRFHSFGVCKGNQPPADWSAAPEEMLVQIEATKAQAQAAQTTANAITNNLTTIDGGLILTSLIKMLNAGVESAGMAAKTPTNDIAFWGGGTLAQAIQRLTAFGVTHSGDAWFNGVINALRGKIGLFDILRGNIIGLDPSTQTERIRLGVENIPDISQFDSNYIACADGVLFELYGGYVAVEHHDYVHYGDHVFSWWTTEPAGQGNQDYKEAWIEFTIPYTTTIRVETVQTNWMSQEKNDIDFVNLDYNLEIRRKSDNSVYGYINPYSDFAIVAGTYKLKASLSMNVALRDYGKAQIYGSGGIISIKYVEAIQKTAIGKDGFYSYFSAIENLIFKQGQGLKVRGNVDMPGLLAAGFGEHTGNHKNRVGSKTSAASIQKVGVGIYNVFHNVGHNRYTVQITPTENGAIATTPSNQLFSGSFQVAIMNRNGSFIDSHFHYAIFGDNDV